MSWFTRLFKKSSTSRKVSDQVSGGKPEETSQASAEIVKYCHAYKTEVKIRKTLLGNVLLLECEHTFKPGIFECNKQCVYSSGVQMGAQVGIEMSGGRLNPDGTIPLRMLKQVGSKDYTSAE
jgi:hypothetical protein